MIVAQISDTHVTMDTDDADQRIRDFECAVADINALDPAPDVIVHTGDIVHNGCGDEYAEAVRILSAARAPVFVLPGNKDERTNLRAAFSDRGYLSPRSPFIDYAVEDFPVRLMVLDTLNPGSNKGDFCAARADRLRELAAAGDDRPVAVFAHHPPFEVDVGPDPVHFDDPHAMALMRETLQQCDRIVGLFCGHVHRFASGAVGDIPVSIVTAVSTKLRKGEYPSEAEGRPLYYLHTFAPEGGFTTETRIAATRCRAGANRLGRYQSSA
jgi:Icc protein